MRERCVFFVLRVPSRRAMDDEGKNRASAELSDASESDSFLDLVGKSSPRSLQLSGEEGQPVGLACSLLSGSAQLRSGN